MADDYDLNMNFMDENPQKSTGSSRSLSQSKFQSQSQSESTRIQPHMNTIAQENPNPLTSRRVSVANSESLAKSGHSEKSDRPAKITRATSVKRVQLQEYQHDITQMTMYNIVPSPKDDRDWNSEAIFDTTVKLPKRFDMRHRLTEPRNQGYQGTCAAQVAACMKEWQERKDVDFSGHMSPQFIYNNRQNQMSTGMYGRDVMNILKNIGCCSEEAYPYERLELASEIDQKYYVEASNYKIKSYARVNTIDTLKRALITNGPCYISFPVYNYTNKMWKQHKGEKKLGGHAMTVVGYDKTGFIVRNSWGVSWDMKGYCHFPFTDWGCQYEVWTTIDDESYKPTRRTDKVSRLCKYSYKTFLNNFGKKDNGINLKRKSYVEMAGELKTDISGEAAGQVDIVADPEAEKEDAV